MIKKNVITYLKKRTKGHREKRIFQESREENQPENEFPAAVKMRNCESQNTAVIASGLQLLRHTITRSQDITRNHASLA